MTKPMSFNRRNPRQALEQLQAGNRRFVDGTPISKAAFRKLDVNSQQPHTLVLSCSDSRVPPEIIFDQAPGDLFVVRVAGNVVTPEVLGSLEFAAENFGTRLLLLLGHTHCGAVAATLAYKRQDLDVESDNLAAIIDKIDKVVELTDHSDDEVLTAAIRDNVTRGILNLQRGSPLLTDLVLKDGLMIIGAEYSLATGQVTFFNEQG